MRSTPLAQTTPRPANPTTHSSSSPIPRNPPAARPLGSALDAPDSAAAAANPGTTLPSSALEGVEAEAEDATPAGMQRVEMKIINGDVVQSGEFDFMAALFNGGRFFCGAALLDNTTVLTGTRGWARAAAWAAHASPRWPAGRLPGAACCLRDWLLHPPLTLVWPSHSSPSRPPLLPSTCPPQPRTAWWTPE